MYYHFDSDNPIELHACTFCFNYKDEEIDEIIELSNHLVFNSFNQLNQFKSKAFGKTSIGLRINPEYSSVEVDLYNPCAINSRLGITKENFQEDNLEGVEGLHFHALCEQNVDALEGALEAFEKETGKKAAPFGVNLIVHPTNPRVQPDLEICINNPS